MYCQLINGINGSYKDVIFGLDDKASIKRNRRLEGGNEKTPSTQEQPVLEASKSGMKPSLDENITQEHVDETPPKVETVSKTIMAQLVPDEEEATPHPIRLSHSSSENTEKLQTVKKRVKRRKCVKKSSSSGEKYRSAAVDRSATSRSRKKPLKSAMPAMRKKEATHNRVEKKESSSMRRKTKKAKKAGPMKDETILRQIFNKAKSTFKVKPDARLGDTYIPMSDEYDREPDVQAEYEIDEVPTPEPQIIINNENNGKLFVNGLPFWCTKEEKPPVEYSVNFAELVKDCVEGKMKLLPELIEPNDLDIYHPLDYIMSRDKEYFKNQNRLMTNTIRSLVGCGLAAEEAAPLPSTFLPAITFVIPQRMILYNRKCRFQTATTVFVPGQLMRKRKNRKKRKKKKDGEKKSSETAATPSS
ncbi:unnamed protein product [Caenorhabditis bovis]|uniref:Uncharacterized protein n=1 Tax=Caenorhabditis bovis TaxID=2654633 RepID=A0A8S1EMJ2_9PELO|nr:unnamed protein product [Caenorhabditis bovis]